MRISLLALVLTAPMLSSCFSPNPFAINEDGPRITSVAVPASAVDGQTTHWSVSWRGGDAPYRIEVTFAALLGASEDIADLPDPVVIVRENATTPFEIDVALPARLNNPGGEIYWRVEVRDAHYDPGSGIGNPFLPSYQPSDSENGTLLTLAAP